MKNDSMSGAMIERGVICAAVNGSYKIRSATRYGIITPYLKAMSGIYSVGDTVYYFMFPDGNGMILAAV